MNHESAVEVARRDLVLANRILAREGVIDDFGHVSVRSPADPRHFFLSRSRSPEIVTRDDLMEFTLEGEVVGDDTRRPYSERFIHGAIYLERPEINAVAHHHARSVLPFTVTDLPLKPAFHMGSVIGGEVPKWDSQDEFGDTNMLVDSLPMGLSLAKAMKGGRAVLMRRHGAVCAAESLAAVCFLSIYMNENARLVLDALPHGTPDYLTEGEIEKASKMLFGPMPLERAWSYWKARAGYSGI